MTWRESLNQERAEVERKKRELRALEKDLRRREKECDETIAAAGATRDRIRAALAELKASGQIPPHARIDVPESKREELFRVTLTVQLHMLDFKVEANQEGGQVGTTCVFPNGLAEALDAPVGLTYATSKFVEGCVKEFLTRL